MKGDIKGPATSRTGAEQRSQLVDASTNEENGQEGPTVVIDSPPLLELVQTVQDEIHDAVSVGSGEDGDEEVEEQQKSADWDC